MAPYRLNVEIGDKLKRKMRRYIFLRWGESEGFYGKTSEVVRLALEHFLDEELDRLGGRGMEWAPSKLRHGKIAKKGQMSAEI